MNDKTQLPIEQDNSTAERQSAFRNFIRLWIKGCALLTAVFATILAIVVYIPDRNDYSQASVLKHHRLAEQVTQKIVLVGGSNLAFGIDSTMIQRATGCPVVNMGMNGYLGVRYMLEEVKPYLKPSDIVVLAFEWDNFFKSIDGTAADLLAVVKSNQVAFFYLSLKQKFWVITATPAMAQEKVMRMIAETITLLKTRVTGRKDEIQNDEDYLFWDVVLTLRGTSPEGDVVSHLGVDWPYRRKDGQIPMGMPVEPKMISLMRDFATEMTKRDVSVMVSYTPIMRRFYDRHQSDLSEAHKLITATPPLSAPSPPSAFVFDEPYFFDTVYHMSGEGRTLRTQKLIDDLELQLQGRGLCFQDNTTTNKE